VSNFCALLGVEVRRFIHFAGKMGFGLLGTLVALNQPHQSMRGARFLRLG
jgi:hypothetical protein